MCYPRRPAEGMRGSRPLPVTWRGKPVGSAVNRAGYRDVICTFVATSRTFSFPSQGFGTPEKAPTPTIPSRIPHDDSARVLAACRSIPAVSPRPARPCSDRSEEHTSELQSLRHLVCRLLLEK